MHKTAPGMLLYLLYGCSVTSIIYEAMRFSACYSYNIKTITYRWVIVNFMGRGWWYPLDLENTRVVLTR